MRITWLLTWNPKYYDWDNPEDEEESIATLQQTLSEGRRPQMTWSCGPNKRIQKGDRLFIIRLGIEPKGMVASGYSLSNVYQMPHWDPDKAAAGEWKRYIDLEFDKVLDANSGQILPLRILQFISTRIRWTPMSSGVEIPEEIVQDLESAWLCI